jgi:hypothetical protein
MESGGIAPHILNSALGAGIWPTSYVGRFNTGGKGPLNPVDRRLFKSLKNVNDLVAYSDISSVRPPQDDCHAVCHSQYRNTDKTKFININIVIYI